MEDKKKLIDQFEEIRAIAIRNDYNQLNLCLMEAQRAQDLRSQNVLQYDIRHAKSLKALINMSFLFDKMSDVTRDYYEEVLDSYRISLKAANLNPTAGTRFEEIIRFENDTKADLGFIFEKAKNLSLHRTRRSDDEMLVELVDSNFTGELDFRCVGSKVFMKISIKRLWGDYIFPSTVLEDQKWEISSSRRSKGIQFKELVHLKPNQKEFSQAKNEQERQKVRRDLKTFLSICFNDYELSQIKIDRQLIP